MMNKDDVILKYENVINELNDVRMEVFKKEVNINAIQLRMNKIIDNELRDILSDSSFKNQQQRELELKKRLNENEEYLKLKTDKDNIQKEISELKLKEKHFYNLKTFYSDVCKLLAKE